MAAGSIIDRLCCLPGRFGALCFLTGINAVVWVLLRAAMFVAVLCGDDAGASRVLSWVSMPSDCAAIMHAPWTLLLYMFAQVDFLHLLFNMLWMWWFGMLLARRVSFAGFVSLYLAGGLSGAVFYMLYGMLFSNGGVGDGLVGSSASVMAVVAAAVLICPRYKVPLPFAGHVAIIWVAVAVAAVQLLGVATGSAGGHAAHIGGALAGVAAGIVRRAQNAARSGKKIAGHRLDNGPEAARIEEVLLKVRRSGHKSLTPDERRILFRISETNGRI